MSENPGALGIWFMKINSELLRKRNLQPGIQRTQANGQTSYPVV